MSSDRWHARPVAAKAVGVVATVVPVVAAVAVGWFAGGLLDGFLGFLLGLGATVATIGVLQPLTRRLLPLATLLQLELPFPGRPPSRFGVALRAGSTRSLPAPGEAADDVVAAASDILGLATAISRHDRATRGHSERVRALCDLIAEEMALDADDRDRLRWASLLHDVGKLDVGPDVLNKMGRLSDEEWDVIRRHPLAGSGMVAPLTDFLGPWVLAVEHHHERWDGGGYPHGLEGEQISVAARIVAVADTYEVMTSPRRSYRTPVPPAVAKRELAAVAGSQLDPDVVGAFLRLDDRDLRRAMRILAVILQLPGILRWRTPVRLAQPGGDVSGDLVETSPAPPEVGAHSPPPGAQLPPGAHHAPGASSGDAVDGDAADAAGLDDL